MSFTLLTWNVGQLLTSTRVRAAEVRRYLASIPADIVCLQESPEHAALTDLGSNLFRNEEGPDTHVTITRFPLLDRGAVPIVDLCSTRIAPYEHVAWSTLDVAGTPVRVYNCHFPIHDVGIAGRLSVLARVLDHADGFHGPTIVCGDMNTTVPRAGIGRKIVQWIHHEHDESLVVDGLPWRGAEWTLFAERAAARGFTDALPADRATWALPFTSWEVLGLKLDWVLTRGLAAEFLGFGPFISDHRPALVRCEV